MGVEEPHVPTVVDLFPTADYQEREVYDMFGVVFDGHPDMRRILMPEDYDGLSRSGATSRWAASRSCSPSTSTSTRAGMTDQDSDSPSRTASASAR